MNRNTIRTCLAAGALAVFALACRDDPTRPTNLLRPSGPQFGLTNPFNQGTACLASDAFNGHQTSGVNDANDLADLNNCTSKDIKIATAAIDSFSTDGGATFQKFVAGTAIPCTSGVPFFAFVQATLQETANSDRADVGVWIATDGGNARTGTCNQYNLVTAANGSTAGGLFNPDGDNCAGISGGNSTVEPLGVLSIQCPAAGDTLVHIGSCLAWQTPGQDGVCPQGFPAPGSPDAYRFGTTPGNQAKCNCDGFNVTVAHTGTITIVKNTVGGDDVFSFTQDVGTHSNPTVPTPFTITTVGGTNSQLFDKVQPGTYHITESGPSSAWTFTSLSCSTGGTVSSQTATVTITTLGEDVTCTYTNTKKSSLTLAKHVVNDNGGTANASAWTLTATGTGGFSGTGLPATGADASLGPNFVPTGVQYTLSESGGPTGYSTTGVWSCTGTGGTFTSPDKISVAAGGSVTCTITNDDIPAHLIVIKHVINDNGGSAVASAFTETIGGVTATGGQAVTGTESPGVDKTLTSVGAYTVTEGAHVGYAVSYSADCNSTIALGQTKTCTVTNDDIAAHLIIIKHVINDNAGSAVASAFTETIGGVTAVGGQAVTGTESPGVDKTLSTVGAYTVTEGAHVGYDVSYSADCNATIALGETKTCTVTNNDQGTSLIIIKHVINDNGGSAVASAFTETIGGVTAVGGQAVTGTESPGVTKALSTVGAYTVTEGAHVGYDVSYSADCNGTIALGETKTCTVTNNDIPAHLIIIKHVINDNGGSAVASAFTETIGGVTATGGQAVTGTESPGVNKTLTSVGAYTVTEGTHTGYDVSYSADCNATIALGETKTCTVTNDDIPAHLIVIKHVVNGAGTTLASAFSMTISGVTASGGNTFPGAESPGTNKTLTTIGSFSVDEAAVAGYSKTSAVGCSGTIALGETKTCTITNTELSTIIIEKELLGGGSQTFTFTRTLSPSGADLGDNPAPTLTTGQSSSSGKKLAAATYKVCETNLPVAFQDPTAAGYTLVADGLGNFCATFALGVGETKTIHFVNGLPPGGGTRTIGYWKNWSSCAQSNGKQYDKAIAAGHPEETLDGHLGAGSSIYPIGLITSLTCDQAVNLLAKNAIDGSKRAGDPIYNMVAQLLGAKLNVDANAGTCAALTTALADAQTLLLAITPPFDGLGSYKTTLTAAQAATANSLNAILTSYNEGTLGGGCPTHI